MSTGVVVNPAAGGGRMKQMWPRLKAMLADRLGHLEVIETRAPGETSGHASQLARSGHSLIIAAGGDGTAGEVVDGLLKAGPRAIDLGLLTVGTGADFARGLGWDRASEPAIDAIASGRTRTIDAGRVSFVDDSGRQAQRHFLNIASFGLSGPTDRAVNRIKQRGGAPGRQVFLLHTIAQLLRYRTQTVRITLDGAETIEVPITLVAVANGRYFGGGMMIAPGADMADGWFEVVIYRGAGKIALLKDMNLIYSGRHLSLPLVSVHRARCVEVEPAGGLEHNAALLDIDGESPGRIPARFDILPGALTLRA